MDKTKHTHFNYLNRDTLSRQRKDTYQLSDTSNKNVLRYLLESSPLIQYGQNTKSILSSLSTMWPGSWPKIAWYMHVLVEYKNLFFFRSPGKGICN